MSTTFRLPKFIHIFYATGMKWPNHMGFFKGECGIWAKDLELPKGGDTILYPGSYEMEFVYMPTHLKNAYELWSEDKPIDEFLNEFKARLAVEYPKVEESRVKMFGEPLKATVYILKKLGYEFGFLYEDDVLTGAHFSLLGLDKPLEKQARDACEIFKRYNIKKLITTNPASTYAALNIFPKYMDGYNIDVVHYLDLYEKRLDKLPKASVKEPVVIHDCHFWGRTLRELKIDEKLRIVLEHIGAEPVEPKYTRNHVHCCGAPASLADPQTSSLMALYRLNELIEAARASNSKVIITACPSCFNALYAALKKYGPKDIEMMDISLYIVKRVFGGV